MIVDLRTYTLKPGTMNAYVKAYVDEGHGIQVHHLGRPLGWYVCHDIGPMNQIVHIWEYDDLMDRERRRGAMFADPAWLAYLAKVTPILVSQECKILRKPAGVVFKND